VSLVLVLQTLCLQYSRLPQRRNCDSHQHTLRVKRATYTNTFHVYYKVVQIWPGQTVTCLHTNSPGHIWTTLYLQLQFLPQQETLHVHCEGQPVKSSSQEQPSHLSELHKTHKCILWKRDQFSVPNQVVHIDTTVTTAGHKTPHLWKWQRRRTLPFK
jgi:hypothetical protein